MNKIKIGAASMACDDLPFLVSQLMYLRNDKSADPNLINQKIVSVEAKIAKLADAFGFDLVVKSEERKAA